MGNIKSIKFLNEDQTYDLEVDHVDHQYYLSNGILTSNSHAISYSMISFETAYLKAHYPIEFLLANLMQELESNAPTADDNISKIKQEIRDNGVKILPPNVNLSNQDYRLINKNELLTGFKGIKFVGDDAIEDIIVKRPFKSFKDFMARVDSSKVRANTIQALAASGAFDDFGITRKNIWKYCSDYRKTLTNWKKKHTIEEEFNYKFEDPKDEWSINELYALEHEFIGEAFICEPYKAYNNFFNQQFVLIKQLVKFKDKTKIKSFKGIVKEVFELTVKKETSKFFGKQMAKIKIEDSSRSIIDLTIFPDKLEELKKKLKQAKVELEPGIAVHIFGTTNVYDDVVGLIYEGIYEVCNKPSTPKDTKEKKKANNKSSSLQEEIENLLIQNGCIEED